MAITLRGWKACSVSLLTAKGSFGATARQTRQMLRRIVSITVATQDILNFTSREAEVIQETFVEIGQAVYSKTIAKRHAKGSEPCIEASQTRGKRPVRQVNGEVEVKIEDPIVRAHGIFLSAGTRDLPRPRTRTGDEGWRWVFGRRPVGEDDDHEDGERILISPTNVSNDNHQPFLWMTPMSAPLDIDQLQTFIAIVDTGSFTKAAGRVFKTQSAVSMQMRRLEERVGKQLFIKDGRGNRLTADGDKLLNYARRIIRLNSEAIAAFDDNRLEGTLRIGTPDDYADRYMPEIIGRFAKTHPNVELYIVCEPSMDLAEKMAKGELDIALVTHNPLLRQSDVVRTEPLCWVGSANHPLKDDAPVPLAVGRRDCQWRQLACSALDADGRDYQILFTSWSSTVVAAAVLAGMAVSILPESALRTGMKVLTANDGFPSLPPVQIGLMKRPGLSTSLLNAITDHITACLDNITPAQAEDDMDGEPKTYSRYYPRLRAGHMIAGW